jgi:hypothetical protein
MCRAHESRVLMDSEPAAALGMVLRSTGLPSRSALVAPPLRLAAPAVAWGVCQGGVSSGFSVPRVREPGTAEREPAGLRPEGGRRCPGTRPSCPLASDVAVAPAGGRGLVLRGARDSRAPQRTRRGAAAGGASRGPRDAEPVVSPVASRSPACRLFSSHDWLRDALLRTSLGSPLTRYRGTLSL